jgi:hypothetical protein
MINQSVLQHIIFNIYSPKQFVEPPEVKHGNDKKITDPQNVSGDLETPLLLTDRPRMLKLSNVTIQINSVTH